MEVGGQAVIEGVMMRNKDRYVVAVRLKNGKIKIRKEKTTKYPKIFQKFFIRGIIGLFFMLYDGIRALMWSSNQNLDEDEQLKLLQQDINLLINEVHYTVSILESVDLIYEDDLIVKVSKALSIKKISSYRLNLIKEFIRRNISKRVITKIKNRVGEFLSII